MSKKLFTKEEVKILSENKYVKDVSTKGTTYTDEFKSIFILNKITSYTLRIIFERDKSKLDDPIKIIDNLTKEDEELKRNMKVYLLHQQKKKSVMMSLKKIY